MNNKLAKKILRVARWCKSTRRFWTFFSLEECETLIDNDIPSVKNLCDRARQFV